MKSGSKRFISFVNNYSLLIPLGALSTGYFFYRYANSSQSLWFFWLLPTTMWLIYSMDHVLDGLRSAKHDQPPERYALNYASRSWLIPLYAFIAGLNAVLALIHLDPLSLWVGSAIAFWVVVYLFWTNLRKGELLNGRWKEFHIAAVVSAGMGIFPFLPEWRSLLKADVLVLLLAFFLINLANLRLFARFDAIDDQRLGMASSAGTDDVQNSRNVQRILVLAFGVCALWLFAVPYPEKMSALISMLILLNGIMVINQWKEKFEPYGLYRFWGDFIYLLPGPIAWWFYL